MALFLRRALRLRPRLLITLSFLRPVNPAIVPYSKGCAERTGSLRRAEPGSETTVQDQPRHQAVPDLAGMVALVLGFGHLNRVTAEHALASQAVETLAPSDASAN